MNAIPAGYELKFDERQIADGVGRVAHMIRAWLQEREAEQVVAIVILRGAMPFFVDVMRCIPDSMDWSFVQAKAYEEQENGIRREKVELHIEKARVVGKRVLLIDDICDSGRTLQALKEALVQAGAVEVMTAVLLRRDRSDRVFDPDWYAFAYGGDEWFVGYGMDDGGRFRGLPHIYLKKHGAETGGEWK